MYDNFVYRRDGNSMDKGMYCKKMEKIKRHICIDVLDIMFKIFAYLQ